MREKKEVFLQGVSSLLLKSRAVISRGTVMTIRVPKLVSVKTATSSAKAIVLRAVANLVCFCSSEK